jgi:hypothetical protein
MPLTCLSCDQRLIDTDPGDYCEGCAESAAEGWETR